MKLKQFIALVICLILIVSSLFACTRRADSETDYVNSAKDYVPEPQLIVNEIVEIDNAQVHNLAKLCKVWGFAKYTHQTFLTGQRCWDEELLALIPVVRFAAEDEVNDILYAWFVGLGDDGYDLDWESMQTILLDDFPNHSRLIIEFFEDADNHNWTSVQELIEELWLLAAGREINLRPMANLSWINADYLGTDLTAVLSRFNMNQAADRTFAPVYFGALGNSVFNNKYGHPNMDFADDGYRLLGLFRLWNTVNYFFPYLDIIDSDWNETLLAYIPKMLEGEDSFSYEVTLVTLASRLQSAHVNFSSRGLFTDTLLMMAMPERQLTREIFHRLFGSYFAPVSLLEAEGYLVVSSILGYAPGLKRGDVILRVNNRDIEEIVSDMLQYLPYPNEQKALAFLVRYHSVLRQQTDTLPMALDILRNGEEFRIYADTVPREFRHASAFFDIRSLSEYNIGLVSPSRIFPEGLYRNDVLRGVMREFANANIDGLIIDLRQGTFIIHLLLAEYLLAEQMHFATFSRPFGFIPGVFVDAHRSYAGYGFIANEVQRMYNMGYEIDVNESFGSFFHDRNVVILMNENSRSHVEYTIMALRNGLNVTVMGTNSIGSNGFTSLLPLPGGLTIIFNGQGVFTPDGGQTQRIGLVPDIYVPRTIAGIRDGRDELMEAAIEFLASQ